MRVIALVLIKYILSHSYQNLIGSALFILYKYTNIM